MNYDETDIKSSVLSSASDNALNLRNAGKEMHINTPRCLLHSLNLSVASCFELGLERKGKRKLNS